ncbi:MAG: DNA modification methylase [Dehalococcoidia bacterium]|nr:DNA modification methylase [Dehalococcoidia bacterium]
MQQDPVITLQPLASLRDKFHPANPKAHAREAIQESIRRFGFMESVAVSGDFIAAGHGRIEALIVLRDSGAPPPEGIEVDDDGEWLVPTLQANELSPEELEAYLVAANRTGEIGGWHESVLAELLSKTRQTEQGLAGTGFSGVDLDKLIASMATESREPPDPDDAPAARPSRDVRVQFGELYRLGDHRLLVGDARNRHDVRRATGTREVQALLTDPPYGVEYEGKTAASLTIANDDAAGLSTLLDRAFANANEVLQSGAASLVFNPAGPLSATFLEAFASTGWTLRQTLIWLKDSPVLGHADHHYRHEGILYGRKPGPGRWGRGGKGWYGGNDQSSVYEYPRPKASRDHPTAKPVRLIEALITNVTRRGDTVLDLFTGSGSCLIACERLQRRFVGLEIDPIYAQVTVDRWERYTGRTAVREAS